MPGQKDTSQTVSSSDYKGIGETVRKGTQNYFDSVKKGKSGTGQKVIKKVVKRSIKKEKK